MRTHRCLEITRRVVPVIPRHVLCIVRGRGALLLRARPQIRLHLAANAGQTWADV